MFEEKTSLLNEAPCGDQERRKHKHKLDDGRVLVAWGALFEPGRIHLRRNLQVDGLTRVHTHNICTFQEDLARLVI